MTASQLDKFHATPLAEFVFHNRERILDAWMERVRSIPCASALTPERLRGRIPEILAVVCESLHTGHDGALGEFPTAHAEARLKEGFDLRSVISELSVLQETILVLWRDEIAP